MKPVLSSNPRDCSRRKISYMVRNLATPLIVLFGMVFMAPTASAINHPPTISWIGDLRVPPLSSFPTQISFTVGDAPNETDPANLTVSKSVTSPNNWVTASNFTLGGTGSTRTVTLVNIPNTTGSATVTLKVTDTAIGTFPALSSYCSFTIQRGDSAQTYPPVIGGIPKENIPLSTSTLTSSYGPVPFVVDASGLDSSPTPIPCSPSPTASPSIPF